MCIRDRSITTSAARKACTWPCSKRPTAASATSRPTCTSKTWAPEDALRRLVSFTVEYQWKNQDFIRLVMNENIHRGEFLSQSEIIRELNIPAIEAVQSVYERGVTEGVFRAGLDPVDLHMSISALSFFNVANQHTFSLIFDRQVDIDARARDSAEMLVRFVKR